MKEPRQKPKKYHLAPQTPLDHWSTDIDPAIMSGQHWEREEVSSSGRDIGWETEENQDLLNNVPPAGAMFMHPTIDVGYKKGTLKERMGQDIEETE